jgi:hypothetical protein
VLGGGVDDAALRVQASALFLVMIIVPCGAAVSRALRLRLFMTRPASARYRPNKPARLL